MKLRVTLSSEAELVCWNLTQNTTFTLPWEAFPAYFHKFTKEQLSKATNRLQNSEEVVFDMENLIVYGKERTEVNPFAGMYQVPDSVQSPMVPLLDEIYGAAQEVVRSKRLPVAGEPTDYEMLYHGRIRRG